MIRIGLGERQKSQILNSYLQDKPCIKKIYVFYFKLFKPKYKTDCKIEYIEYTDIIKYVFFYRLLEEIDNSSLIIIDGCMRTQNRSELTYNCLHHYLNQTEHKIIFEAFPFIESKDDFMILLDFIDKARFRNKAFDWVFLHEEDIKVKPIHLKLTTIPVVITKDQEKAYNAKKEELFENLGNKKPETVPRNLQIFAGNFKQSRIDKGKLYIARNKRFKLKNVKTYKEAGKEDYIIIDTHYRRINMQDFLRLTGIKNIRYLCTTLSIDNYIINDFAKWRGRLEAFYAQANLY